MPRHSLKVMLVIPSLAGGGAERNLVLLTQGLQGRGHDVSVVTIFGSEGDFYTLPEGVPRRALNQGVETSGIAAKVVHNRRRAAAVRQAVRDQRPDVIVSFLTTANVLAILAAAGLSVPVVVTEHADPRRQPLPRAWKVLRRICYRRAAALVSVSRGVDAGFRWLSPRRRAVIYNPIRWQAIQEAGGEYIPFGWSRTVIAMGRLEQEKGYDLLISAFARLQDRFPAWGLSILGEGSQRPQIESLVRSLGLSGRAQLPGALRDPMPTLKRADLFVLPSRYEGFGNALVEAMACGLPAIAADCDSGPREIIRHGVDGLLVPTEDVSALADAMSELMSDADRRARIGSAAQDASRRFDLEPILEHWDVLLNRVATA